MDGLNKPKSINQGSFFVGNVSPRFIEKLRESSISYRELKISGNTEGVVVENKTALARLFGQLGLILLTLSPVSGILPDWCIQPLVRVDLIDVNPNPAGYFSELPVVSSSWRWADKNQSGDAIAECLQEIIAPRLNIPVQLYYPKGALLQSVENIFSINIKALPWHKPCPETVSTIPVPDSIYGEKTGGLQGSESYLPTGGETLFFAEKVFPVAALRKMTHCYLHFDVFLDTEASVRILSRFFAELLDWFRAPAEYEARMCHELREDGFEHFCRFAQEYRAKRVRDLLRGVGTKASESRAALGRVMDAEQSRKEAAALKKVLERYLTAVEGKMSQAFERVKSNPLVRSIKANPETGLTLVELRALQRQHPESRQYHQLDGLTIFFFRALSKEGSISVLNRHPRISASHGVLHAPNLDANGSLSDVEVCLQVLKNLEQGEFDKAVDRIISYLERGNPSDAAELCRLAYFPVVPALED